MNNNNQNKAFHNKESDSLDNFVLFDDEPNIDFQPLDDFIETQNILQFDESVVPGVIDEENAVSWKSTSKKSNMDKLLDGSLQQNLFDYQSNEFTQFGFSTTTPFFDLDLIDLDDNDLLSIQFEDIPTENENELIQNKKRQNPWLSDSHFVDHQISCHKLKKKQKLMVDSQVQIANDIQKVNDIKLTSRLESIEITNTKAPLDVKVTCEPIITSDDLKYLKSVNLLSENSDQVDMAKMKNFLNQNVDKISDCPSNKLKPKSHSFTCKLCLQKNINTTWKSKARVESHIQDKHLLIKFQCPYPKCDNKQSRKDNIIHHFKKAHTSHDKYYFCPYYSKINGPKKCTFYTLEPTELRRHLNIAKHADKREMIEEVMRNKEKYLRGF